MSHVRPALLLAILLLGAAPAALPAEFDAEFENGLAAADRGDYTAALEAWLPLAEQGYDAAAFNVGLLYRNGWGTERDSGEALMWFWAAGAAGNADAQYNLAIMYEAGEGLSEPSPVEAWAWYSLAAEQGHADAARARDSLGRKLDVDQLTQAHRLVVVLQRRFQ